MHIIYPHSRVPPSFVDRRVQPSFTEPLIQPSFGDPRAQPDFAVPRIRPDFVDPLVQPDFAVPRGYDGVGQTGTSNSVSSADPRRGAYADVDNNGGESHSRAMLAIIIICDSVSVLEEIPSSQEEFRESKCSASSDPLIAPALNTPSSLGVLPGHVEAPEQTEAEHARQGESSNRRGTGRILTAAASSTEYTPTPRTWRASRHTSALRARNTNTRGLHAS